MNDDENNDQMQQDSMENMAGAAGDKAASAARNVESRIADSIRGKAIDAMDVLAGNKKIVGPDKKAKGKLYATQGQAQRAAGVATDAAGKTAQATGAAVHALGTANRGAAAASRAMGAALAAIPYVGAALQSGMEAQAQALDNVGMTAQKAGEKIRETGKKTSDMAKKQIEAGNHQIKRGMKLQNEGVDIGAKDAPTGKAPGIPKVPNVGAPPSPKKLADNLKKKLASGKNGLPKMNPPVKYGIIAAIVILLVILIIVFIVASKVDSGKFKDGDNSNVPYVVSQVVLDSIEIFPDGSGNYTYGFVDENGTAMTLDETLDKVLKTLKDNHSSAVNDLGSTDTERKEFLKLLIQAEVATQFPNLSLKTDGSVTGAPGEVASGITVQTTGKDFVIATDAANAANVLDEAGLTAAISNSDMGSQAKQNVLSVVPDLVRLQNTYKVNALFLIAAARTESGCGTGWDLIDPSTYNWLSVKGTANGGYIDRNGTSWNKYSSYAEASEAWFKLISNSGGSYFGSGKYSVKQIAPIYCGTSWGETVCRYMEQFYGYAGASTERQVAAIQNTSVEASPSQSKTNISGWGWLVQNQNINAYYYAHGKGNVTYDSPKVKGYITQDARDYIVYSDSTGWYIGQGVQIKSGNKWNEFNINLLKNHGVDTDNIQVGTEIEAKTIDIVSQEILEYYKNDMNSQVSAKGLKLNENQIIALIDIEYQNGDVNTQLDNIKKYGENSNELANTPGFEAVAENDTPTSRAQAVWKLYRYGKYEAISGSPYDESNFGGTPQQTSTGETTETTDSATDTRAPNSGIAQAGGVDANGVTITSGGNIDFLNYAIDCHALVREENFYYSQGRSMPVTRNDKLGSIDCSAYVSMVLDVYGCNDWRGYPHQLTASGGSLVSYAREKNFEFIYEGSASSINEIPDIQSGDIVLMPGHTQIFYGYTSSGDSVWLNCGSTNSIRKQEGKEYGWYAKPIKYVIRVPGGTGSSYSRKIVQTLTNNEDSVQGNIEIKRKDNSGNETTLEYIDEASFDRMISSKDSTVLNYYTMKKGNASTTTTATNTNGTQNNSQLVNGEYPLAYYAMWLTHASYSGWGTVAYYYGYASSDYRMPDKDHIKIENVEGFKNVGPGILIDDSNIERFKKFGVDVSNLGYGDLVDAGVVMKVSMDEFFHDIEKAKSEAQSRGITLTDNQAAALGSCIYSTGNINSFWKLYDQYGSIEEAAEHYTHTSGSSDVSERFYQVDRSITDAELEAYKSENVDKAKSASRYLAFKYGDFRSPRENFNQAIEDLKSGKLNLGSTSSASSDATANATTTTPNTTTTNTATTTAATTTTYNSSSPETATYQGDGYDFARFWLYTISYEDWDSYSYHMNLPDNISYTGGYRVSYKVTEDRKCYISGYDECGNRDIGMGVWLGSGSDNFDRFAAHGYSRSDLDVGKAIPCEIVDQVSQEELLEKVEQVKKDAEKNGVTLKEYQVYALADAYYNYGAYSKSCKSFWSAYKQYGESDQLAKSCGAFNYVPEGTTTSDLKKLGHGTARKSSRWLLFKYGTFFPKHAAYYGNEYTMTGLSGGVVSFDDFLFVGDSRYELIEKELKEFGNNVSVCAVSSSTAKEWVSVAETGSGTVQGRSVTLPAKASNVSVMLGANSGKYQLEELKQVMLKLHERYPTAKIFFNSVYHVGSNYNYEDPVATNQGYDEVNTEMSNFCSQNDWAIYIDITEGIHDENGYMVNPDGEGIHITGEGKTKLVENIKKQISSHIAVPGQAPGQNADAATSNNWKIVVASYDSVTVTSVDSYEYAYTTVISTNSGTKGSGSQATSTPQGKSTTNTTLTYKQTEIDYQPAFKNHTLYFDFLWAVFLSSSDKALAKELAQEALDSKVQITVYSDLQTTQDVSTSALPSKVLYAKDGSTVYEDHYNGTNTTTTTTKIYTSKGCVTLANVWNMEYKNEANTYNEFKSKSGETVREKVEADDNIMKILRKRDRASMLNREYYLIERMINDNKKVSHMKDIFKYYVDMARNVRKDKITLSMTDIINTGLFDLSNATDTTETVKVLLYTSLNLTDEDKQTLYTAVEKMTSQYPDDDVNTQRKKYITSVILNRALLSKFPDSVSGVLSQAGQFPNFDSADLSTEVTVSDSTKTAVDSVVQGGDCSKYSIFFNTPDGAKGLGWDTKYKKTVEDSDKVYEYYTSEELETELKKYEVSIGAGTVMPSDVAQKIIAWAESYVGKNEFYNSHSGSTMVSKNYCAAFVKCAYYEAGFDYIGGNAKDIPHPNEIKFNSDGTVDYSDIPAGAVIVSKGVPVNGVDYGHVCLYVGNGYVIEAGGSTIQKKPIEESFGGKGHNCAPFVGWGFATENQEEAYQKLVVKVGGGVGNYPEGWTKNDSDTRYSTGLEGVYVAAGKQYNVYCQGFNGVWGKMPYSQQDYANSACGATSVAIICSSTNPSITPIETGKAMYSYVGRSFGSRTNAVTCWDALKAGLKAFGLESEIKYHPSKDQIISHLQAGHSCIILVRNSRIGKNYYGGHYVTLLGINSQGEIMLGDPAGGGNNTQYWEQSKIFSVHDDGICFVYN